MKIDNRAPFRIMKGKLPEEMFGDLQTPCYILDEEQLDKNGQILADVMRRAGCKILLAQKAFANFSCYPVISKYLSGTEASGLFEARLGKEEMPDKEVHVFCGAYTDADFDELLQYADHIVFNSPAQLKKFGPLAKANHKSVGIRINPECSTQDGHAIYDPCAPGSRLGTTRTFWDEQMDEDAIALLDGIHFHTLCEQDADALDVTLKAVNDKFGDILPRMKWINMGGGHHITRDDYDVDLLIQNILWAKETWGVEVYLEPGEAVALNAGFLASRVLDIMPNGNTVNAILDTSAACHMPDVIEMPYMPPVYGASEEKTEGFAYRFGGPSCLSGDIIGTYYYEEPLQIGDMVLFGDLAIYSTCKNNTFNGMPLPSIYKKDLEGKITKVAAFGYNDFKERLGNL